MPMNTIARRALQGAGAGLATGLFAGYARDDGSAGAGHYARHALGGAAIGGTLGAGIGARQRYLAGGRQPPRIVTNKANVTIDRPAMTPTAFQLPASTGNAQAPSVRPRPAPPGPGRSQPYTMGPVQITPQMRIDEPYKMAAWLFGNW